MPRFIKPIAHWVERNAYPAYFAGIAVVLVANLGPPKFLPDYLRVLFISLGLVLIVLSVLGVARFNPWREFRDLAKLPYESERVLAQTWREALLRLAHAALYLATAAVVIAASLYASRPQAQTRVQPGSPVATLQLSSATDARVQALIDAITRGQRPGAANQPGTANLQLDPELRGAVLNYLGQQTASGRDHGGSGAPPLWLVVLIAAGVAAALVFFALRKRPDGAAAVSVLTLSGSALAYADHVSRVDPDTYMHVVIALSILSAIIAGVCGAQVWRTTQAGKAATAAPAGVEATTNDADMSFWERLKNLLFGEGKEPESPLVIALLPFILLFTFCVVGYQPKVDPQKQSAQPPPAHAEVSIPPLVTRFPFEPGSPLHDSNHPLPTFDDQLGTLKGEIAALRPHAGDQIVLVGMADCTHFSGKNSALAKARASLVGQLLAPYTERQGMGIVPLSLPQSESCKSSNEQRAVIPYFARASDSH